MRQPTRGFKTPPEIIRFFDQKSLKPAFSWQDVSDQEHAYSFTVAKAVDVELLTLFQNSIKAAIARGDGFEVWREQLVPELQRIGWYGRRRVDDPTGQWKSKIVDFSRPARLQTIFWSNVRSARAAGQWERIQRSKKIMPLILYVRTTSNEPRIEHLAWAGTILPVDDPFWVTHFPPNGWNCRCSVRQISTGERDDLLTRGGYSTDAPQIEERLWTNQRTGEIQKVPVGVDPGWQTNPGLSRAQTLVKNVQARLEATGEQAARARIAEIATSREAKILMGLPQPVAMPVSTAGRFIEEMSAASNVIVAFNTTMARKVEKHGPVQPESFGLIQQVVDDGEIIDENRGDNFKTVVKEIDGVWWKLVLARSTAGFLRVQTFLRTRLDEIRRLRRKQMNKKESGK